MKKYDSYKECVITTSSEQFEMVFTSDWQFKDIESWMLDTFCIDKANILTIRISNVTLYKLSK